MRVLSRLVLTITLTLLAAGAALYEGRVLYLALTGNNGAPGRLAAGTRGSGTGYRAPMAEVARTTPTDVTPQITAYGRLAALYQASVWAPAAGRVAWVMPGLSDGTKVTAGQVLLRLDDATAQTTLATARTGLDRSRAAADETARQARAIRAGLDRLGQILQIRQDEQARVETLISRGSGLQADLDSARLSVLDAQAALKDAQDSLDELANTARQNALDTEDARAAVTSAERALEDLEIRAGITGTFHGDLPVEGEELSAGSELGRVTDLTHMQARLDLTAQETDRVTAQGGGLRPLPLTLTSPGTGTSYPATLSHVRLTEDDTTGTARQVVALLDPSACPCPLPGTFVTAVIGEPQLTGVALLPASALSVDGKALILDGDNLLAERQMTVLRRLGDSVAIAAPETPVTYVLERTPQLGAGMTVQPVWPEEATPGGRPPETSVSGATAVSLDETRRGELVAQVRAADMPDAARQRILAMLAREEVPQSLLDRLNRAPVARQ